MRVTSLLDRWHVWTSASGIEGDSVVIDDIGMRILRGAWAGSGTDEIADQIAGKFDVARTRAKSDVVAVLDAAKARGVLA